MYIVNSVYSKSCSLFIFLTFITPLFSIHIPFPHCVPHGNVNRFQMIVPTRYRGTWLKSVGHKTEQRRMGLRNDKF